MTPNQIRVFKDTKKRANEFAAYIDANGTQYPWVPRDLLELVDVAQPPEDYSEDLYTRQEIEDAPYVVFTRKSDEQIEQVRKAKSLARIAALEAEQLQQTARMVRERTLKEAEDLALASFGLTPEQLYEAGSLPEPQTAALTYKRLKDLDNAIKAERESVA